jgi:DNA-binding response OmpR family regulator
MIYYKNLLLVDDDEDDHEFFLEAVREIDTSLKCNCVFDGEKALNKLKDGEAALPDLIILDTNMPKLNGKQILSELKNDTHLKHIPVIMYSTSFSERDNTDFTRLGAAYYLSKPSKFQDFKSSLMHILKTNWSITVPAPREEKQ